MRNSKIETKEPKTTIRTIVHENMTWVDITPPTEEAMKYLKEHYHFQPLALEDCQSHRQVSKMDVFPDHLFFVFHFNHYNKATRISMKKQWSAFIGDNFLVTVHTGELRTIGEMFLECQTNSVSRENYFNKGSGYLLYKIIDRAIDSYFPVLDKILSLLEQAEDAVFDQDADATLEVSVLRRDIITQRMVMFPTRHLLMNIRKRLNEYSKVELAEDYDDLIDHLNKICQTLDECKEVVEVFKDTDYTLVTHRLNRVVRVLNVFATIVLPFLAVSSLYGMNVPLPGGMERGSLTTFFVLLGVMVGLTVIMLVYFRRRKWI
jgi:magnesium transporter